MTYPKKFTIAFFACFTFASLSLSAAGPYSHGNRGYGQIRSEGKRAEVVESRKAEDPVAWKSDGLQSEIVLRGLNSRSIRRIKFVEQATEKMHLLRPAQ